MSVLLANRARAGSTTTGTCVSAVASEIAARVQEKLDSQTAVRWRRANRLIMSCQLFVLSP
jgi:hypothetical protein